MIDVDSKNVIVIGGKLKPNIDVRVFCELEEVGEDSPRPPLILPTVSLWGWGSDEDFFNCEVQGFSHRALAKQTLDFRSVFELAHFGELQPPEINPATPPSSPDKALEIIAERLIQPILKIRFKVSGNPDYPDVDCQLTLKGHRFALDGTGPYDDPKNSLKKCFLVRNR